MYVSLFFENKLRDNMRLRFVVYKMLKTKKKSAAFPRKNGVQWGQIRHLGKQ